MPHHQRDLPLGVYVLICLAVIGFEIFGAAVTVGVVLGGMVLAALVTLVGEALRLRLASSHPRERVGLPGEQAVNTPATGGARR
jgi:hypothetical protein